MKRILFAVILIIAFSAASFAREVVAEGKTFSALGNYKIELADNSVTINGEEITPFIISYQNSPLEIRVAVKNDANCKTYYVLSDKLSVQYVCNANYFGVEKLDKSFEKEGYTTSDTALNRSEYFRQKALTDGQGCELENTMLIAAYFPRLISNMSDMVAVK
ncbi:MAG TPA: hypothetical protein VMV77_11070 [Bacteroidales bacterium]|nr:hypothetical protein [Bacteroidales bacterium]